MLVNVSAVHDHVDYGVVIDAGSSGSRVHIYEWPHRSDTRMPLIEAAPFKETTKWSKKVEPGLSSYASNPSGAATSIAELLTYVASVIPPVDHARTPVYVYGTAGLRKVPPTEAEHILNAVRDTVHHSPFLFRREWARIISGQEEGTFGWITVNHLKGTLHARQSQDSHLTTVGALDLGGASTQITFAMPPENTAPHPHVLPITLGGVTYQLFSQSLLGFGVDELQRRSAALARAQAPSTTLSPTDPAPFACLPKGLIKEYETPSGKISVTGTSQPHACVELIKEVLEGAEEVCWLRPCAVSGFDLPFYEKYREFVAFSAYYYTAAFLELPGKPTLKQFEAAAASKLMQPYEDMVAQVSPKKLPYLPTYYVGGLYVPTLLSSFGMPMQSSGIEFAESINNVELSWTVGAMMYQADLLLFGECPFEKDVPVSVFGRWQTFLAGSSPEDMHCRHEKPLVSSMLALLGWAVLLVAFFWALHLHCAWLPKRFFSSKGVKRVASIHEIIVR